MMTAATLDALSIERRARALRAQALRDIGANLTAWARGRAPRPVAPMDAMSRALRGA